MKQVQFFLSTVNENDKLKIFECNQSFAILGTNSESLAPLSFLGVSDRHCRIESKYSFFVIKDMRSELGTFVNKTKVVEAILQEGDEIQIGSHKFIFHLKRPKEKSIFDLRSKNPFLNNQLRTLPKMSETNHSVLILGPSGSGKEIIANAIHSQSARREGPFVCVNCSALTETLIESELFGHIKGSFTGAVADRKGAFESARGGTLFLDEIGDLPYSMQAKLLRALENKEIRPVGSDRTITTDVRIIAATHQRLKDQILNNKFRADLFYRLNVINFNIPSLIERMEDFDDIFFELCKDLRIRFDHNSMQILKNYNWPGNIRELKNIIARASAKYPCQTINKDLLPYIMDKNILNFKNNCGNDKNVERSTPKVKESKIKDYEKKMIISYLDHFAGNQKRAAKEMGMPKSTLHDRIKAYQIDIEEFRQKGLNKKNVNSELDFNETTPFKFEYIAD